MNKKKLASLITLALLSANIATTNVALASNNDIKDKDIDINNREHKKEESTGIVLNGIEVDKQLIDINYSKGIEIVPRYIVIHDTDNRRVGSNAQANRDYFANHINAKASAHYTVDQGHIIQVLENNWMGWHVGDGRNPLIKNSNTIGIELCVNADNNFNKTLENGIALTKYLMQKYNIPAENVVRHYDVSGKICPKMMIKDNPSLWTYFKSVISGKTPEITEKPIYTGKVVNVATKLNIREKASGTSKVIGALNNNSEVKIYGEENGWYKVSFSDYGVNKFGYVSKNYIHVYEKDDIDEKPDNPTKPDDDVKPGESTKPGDNSKPEDGDVKDPNDNGNSGGENTTKPSEAVKTGKVVNISTVLNVRNQASTKGLVIAYLRNNDKVKINYEENGWYNVTYKENKTGFVSKNFIEIDTSSNSNNNSQQKPNKPENPPSGSTGDTSQDGGNKPSTSKEKSGEVINVSTSLNVRSKASSTGDIIGKLKPSEVVKINSETKGWYYITYHGDKKGYVSSDYIKVISKEPTKPSEQKPNNDNTNNNQGNKPNNNEGNTSAAKIGKVKDISTNLNVRKGPGTNHHVIAYLRNNTEVEVLGEENGWYKIKLKDGKVGYASKSYIGIVSTGGSSSSHDSSNKPTTYKKGRVVNVSTNLNMRSGAGTKYSVVAYLLPNKEVTIKDAVNGWYKVETVVNGKNKTGYVNADYIKIEK